MQIDALEQSTGGDEAFFKRIYIILSGVLFLLLVSETLNGAWIIDFWEHSACVREIATNPFRPKHPQLLLDAPHAFFSPYLVIVGWVSRLAGVNAVDSLRAAGLVNLVLFLVGARLFCRVFSKKAAVPSLFLIFLLFFWGWRPWVFSGFFHFNTLGLVLPLPSTFAMAAAFLGFWMMARFLETGRAPWFLGNLFINSIVLLTHPTTALFLWVGIAGHVAANAGKESIRPCLLLLLTPVLSLIPAALWPYYPALELIFGEGAKFHGANHPMYAGVFERAFLLWAALPILYVRLKRNRRDALSLIFIGLLSVYAFGWFTRNFAYGRVLSAMGIVLQLSLAIWISDVGLTGLWSGGTRRRKMAAAAVCLLFISFASVNYYPGLLACLPGRGSGPDEFEFLASEVEQYSVVCSDLRTSWFVPAFGGKIIATFHPTYFVPDIETRKADLRRFFAKGTSTAERGRILGRYDADYLLINKNARGGSWEEIYHSFESMGESAHMSRDYILIRLNKP